MTAIVVGAVIVGGVLAGAALERIAHRARVFDDLVEYSRHRRWRDTDDDAADLAPLADAALPEDAPGAWIRRAIRERYDDAL